MYKEVALDPQCMSEYHYYGLLKGSFGFEKGRYVVAPLLSWLEEAFQSVKNSDIQPVKQKSIKAFLNKLRKNKTCSLIILPEDRAETTEQNKTENWLAWLQYQREHRAFNSIVSERVVEGSINYDQVIDENESWRVPPSIRIAKTEDEIAKVVIPLLEIGDELIIVDQYFRLTANPVLQRIFAEIQALRNIKKITLVTSVSPANAQAVFSHDFVENFNYIPSFKLIVAPERFFHDRYMITNKATIKSGHGFSVGRPQGAQADLLSISLCGYVETEETKQWVETVLQRDATFSMQLA